VVFWIFILIKLHLQGCDFHAKSVGTNFFSPSCPISCLYLFLYLFPFLPFSFSQGRHPKDQKYRMQTSHCLVCCRTHTFLVKFRTFFRSYANAVVWTGSVCVACGCSEQRWCALWIYCERQRQSHCNSRVGQVCRPIRHHLAVRRSRSLFSTARWCYATVLHILQGSWFAVALAHFVNFCQLITPVFFRMRHYVKKICTQKLAENWQCSLYRYR